MELPSIQSAYLILSFLAPGLIILSIRSQFVTGRKPPYSEAVLYYFITSIIYYAIALPFMDLTQHVAGWRQVGWVVVIVIFPALIGLFLGVNSQRGWLRRLMRSSGLNPVHEMPTAWDWKFGQQRDLWILVTLKDGIKFAGFFGAQSFVSSNPLERDMYIQWVYDRDEDDNWQIKSEKGVYIPHSEIKTVEMWPFNYQEHQNE